MLTASVGILTSPNAAASAICFRQRQPNRRRQVRLELRDRDIRKNGLFTGKNTVDYDSHMSALVVASWQIIHVSVSGQMQTYCVAKTSGSNTRRCAFENKYTNVEKRNSGTLITNNSVCNAFA